MDQLADVNTRLPRDKTCKFDERFSCPPDPLTENVKRLDIPLRTSLLVDVVLRNVDMVSEYVSALSRLDVTVACLKNSDEHLQSPSSGSFQLVPGKAIYENGACRAHGGSMFRANSVLGQAGSERLASWE